LFGGTYADDATPDTISVTDTVSGFVANVSLSNGMTTAEMVGALNTAFAATAKHKILGATTVYGDVAGTVPMTTTSKWSELTASGGASLGVASGDTIGYSGVRVNGTIYNGTFSVADALTGTVGDFMAQLQQDVGTGATVSLESGRIAVESKTTGTSQLALTITPNNEGLGTLSFGAVATSVVGKGLMEITASALGSNLVLGHRVYGSTAGFSVAFSGGGADGTAQLGFTAGSYSGTDVAGTIGSYAATGAGQTLSGATGTPVAGLVLRYVGTTARSAGQVSVAAGLGEIIGRITDGWLDTTSGMLQMKNSTISAQVTRLNSQSERQQGRLNRHRASLVKQFTQMEASISRMQSQSASLTNTLNSLRVVA
jgi:flagellar hook-associated protein 2